jgi:hypothetical protein
MTYAAGALSKVLVAQTTASLLSGAATGGTGPYVYQWYRSTTNGFTPGAGNLLSGQTALTLADSGLLAGTTYYYVVVATDTGNSNTTAQSAQLTVGTQAGLSQNQFAQQTVVGMVDLKVGSANVIAAQVDSSVTTSISPGQGVKIVANTTGGIPKVAPITSKSDACIGFARFNQKDVSYVAGQNLEIAMWGTVIWLYATGAVTQFAEVCLDSTFIGGVQATGQTATFVGWAVDGIAAAGAIRVMLMPNIAFATA